MDNRKYEFSVVMPVCNVEPYLREAIESVTGQSAGFDDNIQLILVDDGSTDGSDRICREYQEKYPDNIIYIRKENGGVSSARNEGMRHVSGRYVTFMDADDVWDARAFGEMRGCFGRDPELKIAAGRLMFAGRSEGIPYFLDYVHRRTATVDIMKQPANPVFGLPRVFFDAEFICGERFDERVAISEDQLFLTRQIMRAEKIGIVREASYYYRRREDQSSAFDGAAMRKDYYTVTPQRVFLEIIRQSREMFGSVIPYVQHVMLVNIRLRLQGVPDGVLTVSEKAEYIAVMDEILSETDERVILSQRNIPFRQRMRVLRARSGTDMLSPETRKRLMDKIYMNTIVVTADRKELYIAGLAQESLLGEGCCVYARDDRGQTFNPVLRTFPDGGSGGLFSGTELPLTVHEFRLPLRKDAHYRFFLTDGEGYLRHVHMYYGSYARLTDTDGSYFRAGRYIVRHDGHEIHVIRDIFGRYRIFEERYCDSIFRDKGVSAAQLRQQVEDIRNSRTRRIWLVSDEAAISDKAVDEIRSIRSTGGPVPEIYVIGSPDRWAGSPDIAGCAAYGSEEHIILQAASERVFCASEEDRILRPVSGRWKYVRDFADYSVMMVTDAGISCIGNLGEADIYEWMLPF